METISAGDVRTRLRGPSEIALIDVREFGQYGEGQPFFAVNIPYSRLEHLVPRLIPRRSTPVVLCDAGDGISGRAAVRLGECGYERVLLLERGGRAWESDGYTLYKGVNLPSKTLGEFVEEASGTPRISVAAFVKMRKAGRPILLFDGRTGAEHRRSPFPAP